MSLEIESLFMSLIQDHEYAFEEYQDFFIDAEIENQYQKLESIIAECEFISLYLLDIDEDFTNFHQRMIRTKLVDQFYWQQLGEKNGVDYSCLALVLSDGETLYVSLDSCHYQQDDNHPKDYKKAGKVLYLSKKED